jgi:hypothetical protein
VHHVTQSRLESYQQSVFAPRAYQKKAGFMPVLLKNTHASDTPPDPQAPQKAVRAALAASPEAARDDSAVVTDSVAVPLLHISLPVAAHMLVGPPRSAKLGRLSA